MDNTQTEVNTERDKIRRLIDALAADPDILGLVKATEARPQTTKGHYGDYMAILSPYPRNQRLLIAAALIQAGADREGVAWAVKLLTGGF